MTSCLIARENISAYIDDELNADERHSFEEHVNSCKECREELNEFLKIAKLCKDLPQQELPADFKVELHEKLLAVAAREDGKVRSIKKPRSFFFTKTFASIAAGIILIFIAGNFYRYGIFSPMTSKDSVNSTAMTNEQPSEKMAEDNINVQFSEARQGEATVAAKSEPRSFGASAADASEGITIDRSVTVEERESAIIGSVKMKVVETAVNKASTITILADDTEALSEKVMSLALDNSGEMKEDSADTNNGEAGLSLATTTTSDVLLRGKTDNEMSQESFNFVIPAAQYSQFVTDINTAFGEANIQAGAFVTEDMTEVLNSSIAKTIEIDNLIQELQGKDIEKNSEEIKKLETQKDTIDSQIEEIRLGNDFVNVTVFINKK